MLKGKDSRYKLFWNGNKDGTGGVGLVLAEKWIDKVFDVKRFSDRIMLVKLMLGITVVTFLSVYAPQSGLSDSEKEKFCDLLQNTISE